MDSTPRRDRFPLTRQEGYGTIRALIACFQDRFGCPLVESPRRSTGSVLDHLLRTTTEDCETHRPHTIHQYPQSRVEVLNYLRLQQLERRQQILAQAQWAQSNPARAWTVATLEQYMDYDPIYHQLKRQCDWFEQLIHPDAPPTRSFVELFRSIACAADLSVHDQPTQLMKDLEWHLDHDRHKKRLDDSVTSWTTFIQRRYRLGPSPALQWLVDHVVYARKGMDLFCGETIVQRALWFRDLTLVSMEDRNNVNQMAELFQHISMLFPTRVHEQWSQAIEALSTNVTLNLIGTENWRLWMPLRPLS